LNYWLNNNIIDDVAMLLIKDEAMDVTRNMNGFDLTMMDDM
jgi:hypothetical protein